MGCVVSNERRYSATARGPNAKDRQSGVERADERPDDPESEEHENGVSQHKVDVAQTIGLSP